MKIVRFLGGLGNQMFQYAFYLSLQKDFLVTADLSKYESYVLHNGFELEDVFNLSVSKGTPLMLKLVDPDEQSRLIRMVRRVSGLRDSYYEQKDAFFYDGLIYSDRSPKLYWGYWQNPLYFNSVTDLLRQKFTFKQALDGTNQQMLDRINSENSISIHVRRNDYVNHPLLGGLCTIDYYHRAVELTSSKVTNPKFFVFSDDLEWCKRNLQLRSATYVTGNTSNRSYIDMQLMSYCKHNIIANSSFSWWAAWLNQNKGKFVVAPQRWVNDPGLDTSDLVPKDWIKL